MVRSLKLKIILASFMLIVILAIAILFSIREFDKLGQSLNVVIGNNYKSVQLAQEILYGLDREETGILTYLLGEKQEAEKNIRNSNLLIDEAILAAKNNITERFENNQIEEIEINYNKYFDAISNILTLGDAEKANDIYKNTARELYLSVRKSTVDFMTLNQTAIFEQSIRTKESAERALMPIIVSILIAVLFILLYSFFMIEYIVKPINQITEEAKSFYIQKGRLLVNSDTDDEIREMVDEINKLIARLRAN